MPSPGKAQATSRGRDQPAVPMRMRWKGGRASRSAIAMPDRRSRLETGLRHELRVEVGLDRLAAALRAIARILDAAERHLGNAEADVVDRHHPRLDLRGDRVRGLRRLRPRVCGEAE